MKRILLIIEHLGSGGAERQICGLASMLTNAGYQCRLITYVENQFYEPYLIQNQVEYQLVTKLQNKWFRIFRAARYVNRYNPDIVISFLPSVNMTMCLAKLFYRARLIVSERNNSIHITLKDFILYNLYRIADAIVPNSNSQGHFIRSEFKFLSHKVRPIVNFVDVQRFTPSVRYLSNECTQIIIVARYAHQKNVLTFLDVVRMVKDTKLKIHFDWFGSKEYDRDYYSKVINKYNNLHIEDYLTLHDACDNIEEEYKRSDALCLPSFFEGYPNALVEAMACGLPVICSNRFENPYIVENNVNGFLFNPENKESIYNAIYRLSNLTIDERCRMGALNRELCLKRNTKQAFLNAYVNLIEEITNIS